MKVNYDFYTGKDNYCDGEVEKDIITYLEKYGEEKYDEIFKKDIRWPVFYHITPIRKNILKWYPIKKDAEVLEIGGGMGAITRILCDKAKQVTAVELSKQRASAIQARCKDKENLEIIVGNFNDIKFTKKYDYITLIGVLEYASLYTNTNNPFEDFLKQINNLLKEDGKLLIAIENQFGMKYFSGAPEDHTGKIFDGIEGYQNKKGIRTFGKVELKNILQKSGLEYTKFYYPMPDYKLPNMIYSDNYLPNEANMKNYSPYLSGENSSVKFDEKKALLDIVKNNMFEFFANSFFVEASRKEIDTKVNIEEENEKLIKIDGTTKEFYNKHYKIEAEEELQIVKQNMEQEINLIKENNNKENKKIEEENKKLKEELNKIINSKSWKITKPIRDLRTKKERK